MEKARNILINIIKVLLVVFMVYIFLSSISLIAVGFKLLGKEASKGLVDVSASPVVALFIGILVTSLVQSSSATTSMVVGLVSSGLLPVVSAVPMIMGANIGTTVTNTMVALGSIRNKREFLRSFSGAIIHDFFNLICVAILFPIELATGFLRKTAGFLATLFYGQHDISVTYNSPIKVASKVIAKTLSSFLIKDWHLSQKIAGVICIVVAFVLLLFALSFLVKIMKSMMLMKVEKLLNHYLGKSAVVGITVGVIMTVMVQSSSITTSLMVPLVGTGLLSLEAMFPITLGANIGTTVTALLAALAGNMAGLTIAFVHLLFNVIGIIMIYPVEKIRRIPIGLSIWIAKKAVKNRFVAIAYLVVCFFILPAILIFIDKLLR
jgi:solute carrier family 34 (sodium-dependent phosphate cotransporter)